MGRRLVGKIGCLRRRDGGGSGLVWVGVWSWGVVLIVEGAVNDDVGVFDVHVLTFQCRAELLACRWRDLVVFAVTGRPGLQGWHTVVMRPVVPAHDVWRPDERFGVEADVSFCFPAIDALLEVRVIQPQRVRFGHRVAHQST